jgi:enamine deaminase RidA (YjgF/YER057c/UK114 family)
MPPRAHAEAFATIRPVTTLMQVTAFVDPDWLVEIEAEAVIPD